VMDPDEVFLGGGRSGVDLDRMIARVDDDT
jgi:hypothetical protein